MAPVDMEFLFECLLYNKYIALNWQEKSTLLMNKNERIEKIVTNNHRLRMIKALLFIHQPDWVVWKASEVSAAD